MLKRVSKRVRWFVGIAALLGLVPGLWAIWWEPSDLRVAEECVAIPWPQGKPLRIAVISDLHTGSPFNGLSRLRPIVDRTNAAHADAIVVLGDLVIQGVAGGSFVTPEA